MSRFRFIILIISFSILLAAPLSPVKAKEINFSLTELPRTGGDSQPQVVSRTEGNITELPRTGVPALAWALAAMTPIGARLLKRNPKNNSDLDPNNLWTKRQLDK